MRKIFEGMKKKLRFFSGQVEHTDNKNDCRNKKPEWRIEIHICTKVKAYDYLNFNHTDQYVKNSSERSFTLGGSLGSIWIHLAFSGDEIAESDPPRQPILYIGRDLSKGAISNQALERLRIGAIRISRNYSL